MQREPGEKITKLARVRRVGAIRSHEPFELVEGRLLEKSGIADIPPERGLDHTCRAHASTFSVVGVFAKDLKKVCETNCQEITLKDSDAP